MEDLIADSDNNPESQEIIKKLITNLEDKINEKDFDLEDGSTEDIVLKRAELLKRVLEKLPQIAPLIMRTYRAILDEQGLDQERTGRLSLYIVGGRVHNQTRLKSWSDIDMVITAEKPWLIGRKTFLTREEDLILPETFENIRAINAPFRQEIINNIIPRLSELISTDLSNEGILEIKPSGDQRNEDVANGLCIFTESGTS